MNELVVVGSVTDLTSAGRNCVAVTGSHGGKFSVGVAQGYGVRAALFNDAGVGKDGAGVTGVLQAAFPSATVAHTSARIGEGDETLRGSVSFANDKARALGVREDMSAFLAAQLLANAEAVGPSDPAPRAKADRSAEQTDGRVILLDSASQIKPIHAGRLVVTGSHGAAPGGDPNRAIAHPVGIVAFNDAGVGKDSAGIRRLTLLDETGQAAVAVSYTSARIGDARSALTDGVISHVNASAAALGACHGELLAELYARIKLPEHGASTTIPSTRERNLL